ncbi:uncharacterized protein LOC110106087 isoform X2 [Dendrobium catenatum]|uniref:uncharacterized protein LOC110106087 isoform X2 n=1 Tax=Dendrobium catenatum TaxID=906689 RepID=UPI0009F22E7D|nr:uncharacterized protein LOC110106087 isoform X2 [Dendrobium catenatum]
MQEHTLGREGDGTQKWKMMSPKEPASDSRLTRSSSIRQTPLQVIHVLGNFMRIWSVYALYHHLSQKGDSVILFIFSCLVPASIIFFLLQKPWKGRPLPNSQIVPTIINGAIMALFLILWGKGLLSCGPLIVCRCCSWSFICIILWKESQHLEEGGWTFCNVSVILFLIYWLGNKQLFTIPVLDLIFIDSISSERVHKAKQSLGFKEIAVPILAGVLSALRRVMARRVSLKNQLKRRLHAITVASAACFLFPLAMWDTILGSESNSIANLQFMSWAYLSTIFFGIVFIFYIDNLAEERLRLVFSSPRHLMVATGCIIVMEMTYKMDFSLLGFLICSSVLAFGIFEATSLERLRSSVDAQEISDGTFENNLQMSSLPS